MAASTTRSNTTCFQDYPGTSCEKHSKSSETSVEITPSPTTRPACSSPTGRSSNTCMRSVRRCAKQERRGDGDADQAHLEYDKSIRERADRCGKANLTGPHDGVSDRVGERLATFPVWSAVQVAGHSNLLDSGTSECMLP